MISHCLRSERLAVTIMKATNARDITPFSFVVSEEIYASILKW
jgi:hypothetical protein